MVDGHQYSLLRGFRSFGVYILLVFGSMMLGMTLFLLAMVSTALLYSLRSAPEGYEDDQGFHFVAKSRGVRGSQTTRTRSLASSSATRQHVPVG
jgi:hypothetical protein